METPVQVNEWSQVFELIAVLARNGMEKEQQEVTALKQYIESIEPQYDELRKELIEIRGQLNAIQDKGIRAVALRVVDKVENTITEVKAQLVSIKDSFIKSASKALDCFKARGVSGLKRALAIMKIPETLKRLKDGLHKAADSTRLGAFQLAEASQELRIAGEHKQNAKRILVGKEPLETTAQKQDKGILSRCKILLIKASASFTRMEHRIGKLLDKIQEKKPSVRVSLREVRPQSKNKVPVKQQEKAR